MKISELIEKLEDIRAKEGNLDVLIENAPKNFEPLKVHVDATLFSRKVIIVESYSGQ